MVYKQERLELRLSEADIATLDKVRGSATRSAWLRNQIHLAAKTVPSVPTITDHAYPGEPPMVDQALVVESPATEQMPAEDLGGETVSTNDQEVAVKKHFHKRGAVITSRFDKGVQITTYACAQPGCHHTMDG